jgi:hypothetical protein
MREIFNIYLIGCKWEVLFYLIFSKIFDYYNRPDHHTPFNQKEKEKRGANQILFINDL